MRLTRRAVLAMLSRASTWRYVFILMTLPPLTAAETPMRAQATCTGPLPTTTKPFGSNPILPRHFAIVDWRGKNSTAAKTTTIKPKPGNLTLQPAGEYEGHWNKVLATVTFCQTTTYRSLRKCLGQIGRL